MVFMDFQKAFDTVLHHCFPHKLAANGVNNQVLRMVEEFLLFQTSTGFSESGII